MSELSHVLELFEFVSIDNITEKSLKKAFKKKVLEVHPDKGGNSNDFDELLAAFIYLSDTFQRINGGRLILQNVTSPEKLRDLRPNELINSIFDEFDNEIFNKQFEETHKTLNHGYKDWLKNNTDDLNTIYEQFYGSFPVSFPVQTTPTFNENEFNTVFEESTKKNKPEPTAIILHPEAMAYMSNTSIGTSIIENNEGEYNSDIFTNPEYTDVFLAFTTTNTVTDKITSFKENNKTLDDIIKERNNEIKPFDNSEREAILIFEKNKIAEQTKHLEKVKDFFNYDTQCITQLENWPPEKYPTEAYRGFVIDF